MPNSTPYKMRIMNNFINQSIGLNIQGACDELHRNFPKPGYATHGFERSRLTLHCKVIRHDLEDKMPNATPMIFMQ